MTVSYVCWFREAKGITFDITQNPHILTGHEVDGDTLAAKSSAAPDPVDVILTIAG